MRRDAVPASTRFVAGSSSAENRAPAAQPAAQRRHPSRSAVRSARSRCRADRASGRSSATPRPGDSPSTAATATAWPGRDFAGGAGTDAFIVRGGLRGRISEVGGRDRGRAAGWATGSASRRRPAAPACARAAAAGAARGPWTSTGDGGLTCSRPARTRPRSSTASSRAAASTPHRGPPARRRRPLGHALARPRRRNRAARSLARLRAPLRGLRAQAAGGGVASQSIAGRHVRRSRARSSRSATPTATATTTSTRPRASGSTLLREPRRAPAPAAPERAWASPRRRWPPPGPTTTTTACSTSTLAPGGIYQQAPGGSTSPASGCSRYHEQPGRGPARLARPRRRRRPATPVISARAQPARTLVKTIAFPNEPGPEPLAGGRPPGNGPRTARRSARGSGAAERHRPRRSGSAENETSLYSQGHYRLYFGLGDDADRQGGGALARRSTPDRRSRRRRSAAGDQPSRCLRRLLAVGPARRRWRRSRPRCRGILAQVAQAFWQRRRDLRCARLPCCGAGRGPGRGRSARTPRLRAARPARGGLRGSATCSTTDPPAVEHGPRTGMAHLDQPVPIGRPGAASPPSKRRPASGRP